MTILDLLKKRRSQLGISRNKAAVLSKLGYSHYCGLEDGKYLLPNMETINKLSKGLDVSIQSLMYSAGYLDHQKQDIEGLIKKEFSPILKTEILELLSSKKILDMLTELKDLSGEDKDRALEIILKIINGFK